jgi:tRNA(Ile)-lysidine synthase
MLNKFRQFIAEKELIATDEKTIIAVSGGADSTVLTHLFHRSGLPFAIAHCNFQLRGEAADADEYFVTKLAEECSVPCYVTRFDTQHFAKTNKLSMQDAARQLRYDWLEQIRQEAECQYIATAHHLDDSIETVLFNFSKGCGIRGLHGILPKKNKLIRPLLFATKKEILAYAQAESITFREDHTNLTVKYSRNLIRLKAIPIFEQINPAFQRSASATIGRLQETEQLFNYAIGLISREVMKQQGNEWRIHREKLLSYPAPATVLFELLRPFGFNTVQVEQILQSIENQPGAMFYSPEWTLVSDRFEFIITCCENTGGVIKIIDKTQFPIHLPNGSLGLLPADTPPSRFSDDPHIAWMDADKLMYPLMLRHWQPGDVFQPLGMKGHRQKLQDYFTHQKLSRLEKDRVWLLESGGKIAWVVGMRQDEQFKVLPTTKRYLIAVFQPYNFAGEEFS